MNGKPLTRRAYRLNGGELHIPNAPDEVTLEIETALQPDANTSLMGLYVSNGNFFTQCEAEGFRKITYFPDRPDVMARYTVMLRADKRAYPVLLSNGNLVEEGDLGDGRHYAQVGRPVHEAVLPVRAGGRQAGLPGRAHHPADRAARRCCRCGWRRATSTRPSYAMDSLINSIRWDEERFGLELDLDRFMIVAVGDFNMGAMENKGLNIFNTKYVLANPRIATDVDYASIEAVVGHEYFHNWTGNRVTCRDWFQLSLKEGLTVFRDQEFSADMVGTDSGRAVKRIDDVRMLRQAQFPEDAGPMAHPVRPDSYVEINNFYTVTIYEKGSEVVRMYQTLLGRDGFRKGMDLYFERHDGQAVTCDDFRAAMADASGRDLDQFERWYSQAGTPRVTRRRPATTSRPAPMTSRSPSHARRRRARQTKLPFHIPVTVGLLAATGARPAAGAGRRGCRQCADHPRAGTDRGQPDLPLHRRRRQAGALAAARLLGAGDPGIRLQRRRAGCFLFANDSDPFNRWEAGQRLAMRRLLTLTRMVQDQEPMRETTANLDNLHGGAAQDPGRRHARPVLPRAWC